MSRGGGVFPSIELGEKKENIYLNNEKRELVLVGYIRKHSKKTPVDIVKLIVDFYGLIRSNLVSSNNPLTISRLLKVNQGIGCHVHFDEKVLVQTIPSYDPSRWFSWHNAGYEESGCCSCCGGDDDKDDGCNPCIIL